MSRESTWGKTKRFSKKGFDKAWDTVDKLGGPVNRLSNRLGAEAFWPMTIDKESDKAARILRSFCKDGFYTAESETSTDENGKINRPKGKQKVLQKIPTQVIKNAKGLAIFTTMRTGLWMSGSGGSGVLLSRIPETGEWSPPSGIMLHTAGIGFLAGVDIYDCVVIINTYEALQAFKKLRCTLGGEVSVAAGPVGMGGVLESEVHKRQAPIWNYMKSKGLYAGVAIDGTIIIERTDENERFYGERISVTDILAGKIRHPPHTIDTLLQTIKAAQGDSDVNDSLVPPPGETPGDVELSHTDQFGVPAQDDPDPYGVKALEAEGLFIRDAGTKVRACPDAFEFRPNPGSPVFATFARHSLESSPRSSWRASVQSYTSVDRGTQTDDVPLTATTTVSRASSRSAKESTGGLVSNRWEDESQWDTVPIHGGDDVPEGKETREEEIEEVKGGAELERVDELQNLDEHAEENHAIESDDDFEVHEVSNVTISKPESHAGSVKSVDEQAVASDSKRHSPTFTRARIVTIPKRPGPPLPPRHPHHTWCSESSRESVSPTALSHSSRSTETTEAALEVQEASEAVAESPNLPSNVKVLQTSTVLPAVVDDDDEYHSVDGDFEESLQERTLTEDAAVVNHEETVHGNSVLAASEIKPETTTKATDHSPVEQPAEGANDQTPKSESSSTPVDETGADKHDMTPVPAQAA
ncbi:hypothetical protein N7492_000308 [Penicillium capsulatum]|uniref:Ysc84 actin-binding domain-containing protein n=1 Tax=Penicillium capsulatum TaxID=69766 RepID=A0A9W9LZX1_9EURO|nr:hypothetical protein N7492_000308 [Penicillium capsulatum]KAJ6130628.1 hypothetical protein N7512_003408 [Penicillium capsulatum]